MTKEKEIILKIANKWISCGDVREKTKEEIEALPEYFWHVPASSSGMFHPKYALGEGGLARHTIAVCIFVKYLLEIYDTQKFSIPERSCLMAAAILHDGLKQGSDTANIGHTVKEHPLLMSYRLRRDNDIYMTKVAELVASHMGKFNAGILPLPDNEQKLLLHTADYLASRRDIFIDIDKYIEENLI